MNHSMFRYGCVSAWLMSVAVVSCAPQEHNPHGELGGSVERVVSGDWEDRFADDSSVHRVSMPPGVDAFDVWTYQFGDSY